MAVSPARRREVARLYAEQIVEDSLGDVGETHADEGRGRARSARSSPLHLTKRATARSNAGAGRNLILRHVSAR